MAENLKSKVVKGVIWRLTSSVNSRAVTFIVGLVLARLLGPEAYGTVALLTIFIGVAEALVNGGFGAALIQRKDVAEVDLNSVFYLQFGMAWVMYGVLFFVAPAIASFYNSPILVDILRVQALILPVNAIRGIQSAVLTRNLLFHYSFIIGICSSISSAIVGLSLAFLGYGVWALVWASFASGVVAMLTAVFLVRWLPRLMFSKYSLKVMFRYGWKMLVSDFTGSIFGELSSLVIGKFYTPTDLGLYNRGRQLPGTVMDVINSSLMTVSFPAFSKLQSDPVAVRNAMRKMIQVSCFFIVPMMAGLCAVSKSLILVLLGEKWIGAVPYVMIACFSFALYPFHTINLQVIKAMGESGMYLATTIVKNVLLVLVLFIFCRYSVIAFALACAFVSSPISLFVNTYPVKKLIGYGMVNQLLDSLPVFIGSLLMAIFAWMVGLFAKWNPFVVLIVQMGVGMIFYYLLLLLVRPKILVYICENVAIIGRFFGICKRKT